jgi:hypothetical protein
MSRTDYYANPPVETAIEVALKEALKSWDAEEDSKHPVAKPEKPEEKPVSRVLFPVTTNVSRKTWDYINANPGQTTATITTELAKAGYNPSSVSSLVAQLVRQGQARKDPDKSIHITSKEYQPLRSTLTAMKTHKKSSGIAALPMIKPEKKEAAPFFTAKELAQGSFDVPPDALYQIVSGKQERDYAMEAKVIVAGVSIFVAYELHGILRRLFKD